MTNQERGHPVEFVAKALFFLIILLNYHLVLFLLTWNPALPHGRSVTPPVKTVKDNLRTVSIELGRIINCAYIILS